MARLLVRATIALIGTLLSGLGFVLLSHIRQQNATFPYGLSAALLIVSLGGLLIYTAFNPGSVR